MILINLKKKIKPFIDDFNNSLDILNKFTVWIKDKLKIQKMMLVLHVMII